MLIKINKFWGDVSDISAKTATLDLTDAFAEFHEQDAVIQNMCTYMIQIKKFPGDLTNTSAEIYSLMHSQVVLGVANVHVDAVLL